MRGVFLEHPSSLEHDTRSHPEQAARITAVERELAARDWLGFDRVQSPEVPRDVLHAVHPPDYVEAIQRSADAGGGALDPDTLISPGSFTAALHAAGGAVRMVELLLDGEADTAFSAHRPPGHHALVARAMGFCLFNNVAIAARFALDHRGLERVLILDWDVHHGNGTNDIFHSSDQVLFVSIHQSPLYPGTGPAGDLGSGAGEGYTVNLPVPPGSGDEMFISLVEHVAVPLAVTFEPQLILISAGFDAHYEDPLGECTVTEDGFVGMTYAVRSVARELRVPIGCVLEGGMRRAPSRVRWRPRCRRCWVPSRIRARSRRSRPWRTRPASGCMSGGRTCSPDLREHDDEHDHDHDHDRRHDRHGQPPVGRLLERRACRAAFQAPLLIRFERCATCRAAVRARRNAVRGRRARGRHRGCPHHEQ